jgi:hypothetical protein
MAVGSREDSELVASLAFKSAGLEQFATGRILLLHPCREAVLVNQVDMARSATAVGLEERSKIGHSVPLAEVADLLHRRCELGPTSL